MKGNSETLMEKVKKPTTFSPLVSVFVVQYQLFPTPLEGRRRFLPHSLFHCLVHTQFSSALAQEADQLHSRGLDTALLPSAARIPRPHSAGNGCTATQQTGVKLLAACKKTPQNFELDSIPHNAVNCPNGSHIKFRLFVKSLKLCSTIKWGVTLLQLASYASFSGSQPFSPPEDCVGY